MSVVFLYRKLGSMRVLVTWRQLVIVPVVIGLTILVLKKIGGNVPGKSGLFRPLPPAH